MQIIFGMMIFTQTCSLTGTDNPCCSSRDWFCYHHKDGSSISVSLESPRYRRDRRTVMEDKMISGGLTRREFVKASLMGTAVLAFSSARVSRRTFPRRQQGPFDTAAPAVRGRRPGTRHLGGGRWLPLRQAPPGLRGQPEQAGRGHALWRQEPRGDHPGRGRQRQAAIFNNAAQVWNHTFYWKSHETQGRRRAAGKLAEHREVLRQFRRLPQEFTNAAVGQFGSGWAWLVPTATS